MNQKSKMAAGLLGIFLGAWGVHQFYLGDTKKGIIRIVVSLVTCGIGGIWGFIEGIMILCGKITTDAQGNPLTEYNIQRQKSRDSGILPAAPALCLFLTSQRADDAVPVFPVGLLIDDLHVLLFDGNGGDVRQIAVLIKANQPASLTFLIITDPAVHPLVNAFLRVALFFHKQSNPIVFFHPINLLWGSRGEDSPRNEAVNISDSSPIVFSFILHPSISNGNRL